jgi:hypothetical protein
MTAIGAVLTIATARLILTIIPGRSLEAWSPGCPRRRGIDAMPLRLRYNKQGALDQFEEAAIGPEGISQ